MCVCVSSVTMHVSPQKFTSLERTFLHLAIAANPDYEVQYDTCFSKGIAPYS